MGKPRDLANVVATGNILADGAVAPAELTGVTSTAAEINILDGVTATAAELNLMDGVTATTAELNYVDGVTSNVQTQMNTKAPVADPTFTGTATAPTINASTALQIGGVAVTATAAELNKMDGVTVSASDINAVTAKLPLSGGTLTGDIVAPRFVDSGSSSYYVDPFGTSALAYAYLQQTYAANSALSGTTPTCNAATFSSFSLTTSGNTTFTFSTNVTTNYLHGFILKLTSGGSHTITYPNTVDFAGGAAPDAPASGETDILVFTTIDAGTTWYGARAIDAAA